MKVLKLGRPQNGYTIEHECTGAQNGGGGCGALLQVEHDDMRYYPGVPGDSWGSRDPQVMFRCCECGVVTSIATKLWPPRAYQSLGPFTNQWRDGEEE